MSCYMPSFNLCTIPDEFIEEKSRWVATLSNNFKVYQDDDRPGEEIASAWLRLQRYCEIGKVSIISLHLQFRSNIIHPLPQNAKGYFFSNKIVQFVGGKEPFKFFVLGSVDDKDVITTQTFKIPELIKLEESKRNLSDWKDYVILRS